MKNIAYNIITFISLVNVSKSYIHKGIGHGTHYFSNLREPYKDIKPVSINSGIKFSNQCINDILKLTDIYNDIHHDRIKVLYEIKNYSKYIEILQEINAFDCLINKNKNNKNKNINCLLWSPKPRFFNAKSEPLSLIIYSRDNEKKQIYVNNIIFNPIWNNNKIPLMELKYALNSYFNILYKNKMVYTVVYVNKTFV